MPHAKLVNRKITAMRRKRRNERWYIANAQSGIIFYLSDFDDDHNTALWSRNKGDAMPFRTENGVLQYLSTYLNSRSDVHLVHSEL